MRSTEGPDDMVLLEVLTASVRFAHFKNTTAGDGNPVRHSLISLVPEEDVPLLLEAMAEKLNFEFEDVTSTPSSSNEGIIHDTNERQQRRKIRNVTRIEFKTTPPAVFTYPDESTASESAEWYPGENITFDQYQKICETEKELSEQKRAELSKWQTYMDHGTVDLNSLVSANPASPTATDYELGVTSRISYDSPPVVMVTNNFTPNNLSPLIAGK
ncbi:unnamed protein product [Anisakis simplex]|uniref:Sperm-associated antigen 8 n=1 Tax=Anisakis simplex TaxID=6269 RepID=A0A0M3K1A2_ANISI|nr:unnamed protein product [Anisakis simplex]